MTTTEIVPPARQLGRVLEDALAERERLAAAKHAERAAEVQRDAIAFAHALTLTLNRWGIDTSERVGSFRTRPSSFGEHDELDAALLRVDGVLFEYRRGDDEYPDALFVVRKCARCRGETAASAIGSLDDLVTALSPAAIASAQCSDVYRDDKSGAVYACDSAFAKRARGEMSAAQYESARTGDKPLHMPGVRRRSRTVYEGSPEWDLLHAVERIATAEAITVTSGAE